jgi:hypothetical protein
MIFRRPAFLRSRGRGDTVLADAHGRAAWSPLPGKYTLFLENEDGQALASVPFEVRGNIAR